MEIKIDPKNARKHGDTNRETIKNSLKECGAGRSIVMDADNVIIGGNGVYEQAKELGLKVRVIESDGSELIAVKRTDIKNNDDKRKILALADNRTAELAEWDNEVLTKLMAEIPEVNLEDIGFDDDFMKELNYKTDTGETKDADAQVDKASELNKKWQVKKGDLFQIGKHRLLCGDSTNKDDVAKLMDGRKPMLMITDPPYGVKLDQSWRDKAMGSKMMGPGNKNIVENDERADWTETWELFEGDIAYIWHASKFTDIVMDSLRKAGFEICQQIIWNKSIMVMGRCDYHFKHEPCWYAVRKGKQHLWIGDRKQTTIIDAKSPNHIMSGSTEDKTEHPTQKPVDCFMLMRNHESDIVYEPFCGSGTAIVASENVGRSCVAMELSPDYCAVILQRMSDAFSGIEIKKL